MEEEKSIGTTPNFKYMRAIPRMADYLKNKNIASIFKDHKRVLFAAGGGDSRIELFTNSLEHMGSLCLDQLGIRCLSRISKSSLASVSGNNTINIWDIENKILMSTLYGDREWITALCAVRESVLVSGSNENSLIIWNKSPESPIYSVSYLLTGHTSNIKSIIKSNTNTSIIISGEKNGNFIIWDIDQGLCIRRKPCYYNPLSQMKQHVRGEVAVSYSEKVIVWGVADTSIFRQFTVCSGKAIEFLSRDILLRGGRKGQLEFVDYMQTGRVLPRTIRGLHSHTIYAMQRIAKNIVITFSADGYLKVIDPIYRKCHLKFKKACWCTSALAYFN